MGEPTIAEASNAIDVARTRLVDEFRTQLAEARAQVMSLARELVEERARALDLARELDATRIELVRRDERIAELEGGAR